MPTSHSGKETPRSAVQVTPSRKTANSTAANRLPLTPLTSSLLPRTTLLLASPHVLPAEHSCLPRTTYHPTHRITSSSYSLHISSSSSPVPIHYRTLYPCLRLFSVLSRVSLPSRTLKAVFLYTPPVCVSYPEPQQSTAARHSLPPPRFTYIPGILGIPLPNCPSLLVGATCPSFLLAIHVFRLFWPYYIHKFFPVLLHIIETSKP